MADIKTKLFPLFRRSSASSAKSSNSSTTSIGADTGHRIRSKTSLLLKGRGRVVEQPVYEEEPGEDILPFPSPSIPGAFPPPRELPAELQASSEKSLEIAKTVAEAKANPVVTLEEPTPDTVNQAIEPARQSVTALESTKEEEEHKQVEPPRPEHGPRKQSQAHSSQARFIRTLIPSDDPRPQSESTDYFGGLPTPSAAMLYRKIWVKRPGASATLVVIKDDDLVDDVRDMILKKYANSLGRSFDSPDVTLRIVPRDHTHRNSHSERILGPEESIMRALDAYYPGGQTVDEALVIDVPQRRTPRQSPRVHMPYYVNEDVRPGESGTEYFPPMPVGGAGSPHLPTNLSVVSGQGSTHHHAIAVLNTGQVPPLPSPGGSRGTARHSHRPKYARNNTSSPTVLSSSGIHNENRNIHHTAAPTPPPLPTPPIQSVPQRIATPPPRLSSPRPTKAKRNPKKGMPSQPAPPTGLLDGSVPPINVLIVEDNPINLRLLEAFMKRLKVRWQTAMNGREAVTKWRGGGFHLVLMDIQMPVMNGLEAAKEIRRLEHVNGVGVLAASVSGRSSAAGKGSDNGEDEEGPKKSEVEAVDRLMNTALFKSPVIIVALTASSLQSDRHEALAAGCNDFLTKPPNFVWLERKVMEWGCMQALIDFDGWRKWKDFSQAKPAEPASQPVAPLLLNTDSGSTIHSVNSADSPRTNGNGRSFGRGEGVVGTAANNGNVGGREVGNAGVSVATARTGRKAKRSSLGAGSKALSGVLEDSGEGVVVS